MSENILWQASRNVKGHWYQGAYSDDPSDGAGDGDGSNMCAIGHLRNIVGDKPGWLGRLSKPIKCMNIVIEERYPNPTIGDVVSFNDHPDTTEDDVVMVMEKAALIMDKQDQQV